MSCSASSNVHSTSMIIAMTAVESNFIWGFTASVDCDQVHDVYSRVGITGEKPITMTAASKEKYHTH